MESFLLFCRMQAGKFFQSRIPAFAQNLEKLNVEALQISAYSKRYLQYLLRHRFYFLAIYSAVLEQMLDQSHKAPAEIVLIDYGAGNGLLGLFAKFCGCPKVFLCDTDPDFINAASQTADAMNIRLDGYTTGDLVTFKSQFPDEKIDAIIGTDVIEHIYDLNQFFTSVRMLNSSMVTVFTTASNPENYLKLKKLRSMQVHDELEGGDPSDFELAGETAHPPFLEMRKLIIQEYDPTLEPGQVDKLASLTRGRIKEDILRAVEDLKQSGIWPVPAEGTNTCHPLTGSWSERVLSLDTYRSIYRIHGFDLEITNGFYDSFSKNPKSGLNIFMNILIKIMGKKIAPFITLSGFPKRGITDIC
jgi:2-polyprenyl-3-methyl-5-hydroxy-6-metoxy-1,4-benzoquinol methylase